MQRDYWPTKAWQTAELASLGMSAEKITELDPMIQSEYGNINGIVVVRNGFLAYEQYYNGYGPNDTHHMASVTKSIVSALVGIAIDAGYIKNADQRVLDFFPEYVPNPADQQKQDITIRHLLTMTAPYSYEQEPFEKLCMSPDWAKFILDMLGQNGSIGNFKYSTAGAHLLSVIITRSTGKSARAFANEYLFRPIGMKEISDYKMKGFGFDDLFGKDVKGWVKDPSGNSTGGWGLTLAPRDMARFGFLYLNKGLWDNQQILPEAWIRKSTAMNPNYYGYLWWLCKENGVFAYMALGDGGNMICCIPKKDLVVAIASEFMMNPRDRWMLIEKYILPTIIE